MSDAEKAGRELADAVFDSWRTRTIVGALCVGFAARQWFRPFPTVWAVCWGGLVFGCCSTQAMFFLTDANVRLRAKMDKDAHRQAAHVK